MTTSLSYAPDDNDEDDNRIDETKTLISALSFLSRNLPLPPDVFDAVNSIYENGHGSDHLHDDDDDELADNGLFTNGGDLMADLEDALAKQQNHMTGAEMAEARKKRIESHIQTRLTQLEDLPTSRGEDLQTKCLIELYGLKVNSSLEVLAFSYFLLYLKIFRMLEMFDVLLGISSISYLALDVWASFGCM
ncbi:hypothetical protein Tco_1115652 [Tanacetum coccineum]